MDSLPLFKTPPSESEIVRPIKCESADDMVHKLKQLDVVLNFVDYEKCLAVQRRAKPMCRYYAEFVMWLDGNWACLHEEFYRSHPIPPGQYKKAYLSSRDAGEHIYYLETCPTRDLIFHR